MKLATALTGCLSLAVFWGGATRSQARDCNQNGVEDSIDLSAGTSVDCNSNGVPDECDLGPTRFDLEAATHFAGGDDPLALALGDLDGDNHLDVVVAEGEGDSVFLQLGDGSGGFEEAGSVDVGDRPLWVVVADVDGDGPLDIVTANRLSDNVTVLWNDGDASFAESSTLSVDDNPVALTLADFDGDGDLDLATANSRGDSVSIVERTGTRTFGTAVHITVVDHPRSIIAVDTDGDGDLDLVTANQHSGDLAILSNTDGNFSTPASIPIQGTPRVVVSGDQNADGDPDLIVASGADDVYDPKVSILRRSGDGQYETSVHLHAPGAEPNALTLGDVTEDGVPDIVVAFEDLDQVVVYRSRSNSVPEFSVSAVRAQPRGVALGDVTGDGKLDVVTANLRSDEISVLENSTTLQVSADCNHNGIPDACDLASGVSLDCNRNGVPDTCDVEDRVSRDCNQNGVPDTCDVESGVSADCNGNGYPDACELDDGFGRDCDENGVLDSCDLASGEHFDCNENGVPDVCDVKSAPYRPEMADTMALDAEPYFPTVADVDGDGDLDIVLVYRDTRTISIFENDGHGRLTPGASVPVTDRSIAKIVDMDSDGSMDIVMSSDVAVLYGDVAVLYGDGVGGYGSPQSVGPGRVVTVGDIDGDGLPDLIIIDGSTIALLINEGERAFSANPVFFVELGVRGVTVADVDGDGLPDLIIANVNTIALLINEGERAFAEPVLFELDGEVRGVVLTDLGGDGDLDIAAGLLGDIEIPPGLQDEFGSVCGSCFALQTFENLGDGTFGAGLVAYVEYPFDTSYSVRDAADFDGDGVPEIFSIEWYLGEGGGSVRLLRRQADGLYGVSERWSFDQLQSTRVVDVDANGTPDLVIEAAPGDVSVTLNLGDGSFSKPKAYRAGASTVADLSGDGLPDLVGVIDPYDSPRLAIARNTGEGSFAATRHVPVGFYGFAGVPVTGDVDGDGDEDFVAREVDWAGDTRDVYLHENLGNGTFRPVRIRVEQDRELRGELRLADLDGQGHLDILLVDSGAEEVRIFLNPGDLEAFGFPSVEDEPIRIPVGARAADVALGDMDGDADLDIVAANRDRSSLSLFENQTGGTFDAPVESATREQPSAPRLADLDGDGDLDVMTAHPTLVSILANQGAGTLALGRAFGVVGDLVSLQTADLDGDGDLEILFLDRDTDTGRSVVLVFENLGSGVFAEDPVEVDLDPEVQQLEAVDLDADGVLDLVARRDAVVFYSRNLGALEFAPADAVIDAIQEDSRDWRLADLEGDGDVDVLLLGRQSSPGQNYSDLQPVTLHLNDGDASFSESRLSVGLSEIADFDRDGLLDLLGWQNFGGYGVYTLAFGRVAAPFSDDCDGDGTPDSCQLTGNDCDESGVLDRCEIASGIALDCNGDGVPDSCQLDGNDCNGNGIPDDCDGGCVVEPLFQRGDCNGDGEVSGTVTDAVYLLNFNFGAGPRPGCLAACDANGDGEVIGFVTDAVYMLRFSFLGGPQPPAPHPGCGEGTASDAELGCETVSEACGGG